MRSRLAIAMMLAALLAAAPFAEAAYRTYAEIGAFLQGVAADHPEIARLHLLGTSVQGRNIWALQITDNPDVEEDEPEFSYISTIHGDEWVGNEMCLYFIDYLTDNYGIDPNVTDAVNEIDIWIVPLMNPDGFVVPQRYNAQGYDLNRNFPDPYTSPINTPDGRPKEVGVIMEWRFDSSFTLSANLHGGALVVNYPFDNNASGSSVYTPTPDDDLMIFISEEYSRTNLPMWNSSSFYHGITNGADWYAISGGMQDWNYHYLGCNEVTIELSNTKIPPASQIPTYWSQNRDSMFNYMKTCLLGVRGTVTDAVTGAPLFATVTVVGRAHPIYTDPDVGDYHRMLRPGTYNLLFEADGYDPVLVQGVQVVSGPAVRLDVQMYGPPQVTYPNGGENLAVNVPVEIQWQGSPSAAYQVQYSLNSSASQVVSDDFERTSLGADYATGGNRNWYITTSSAHAGVRSVRAGAISHSQTTWLTRAVGGGPLSFWYRVSSETGGDYFNFYVDDQRLLHLSGTLAWQQYSTTLPAGEHIVKFEYVKNAGVSSGSDTVWIDDLQFSQDGSVWHDVVALTEPGAMSVLWNPSETSADCKVRVRASAGGGSYGRWDYSDAVFSISDAQILTGDIDGDGDVDLADLALLLAYYGQCQEDPGYDPRTDLDQDGCTSLLDLAALLAHYGETLP